MFTPLVPFLTILGVSVIHPLSVNAYRINDTIYSKMPKLYELEDFDLCESEGPPHKYCLVEIDLSPLDQNNSSEVWNIIKTTTADKRNFRHDRLERGVCLFYPNWNNTEVIADLERRFGGIYAKDGLKVRIANMYCNLFDKSQFDLADVLASCMLIVILLLALVATVYDGILSLKNNKNKPNNSIGCQVLLCFSIMENWKRLGTVNKNDERDIVFLQSVKFMNMALVVMGHTCLMLFVGPIYNPEFLENIYSNFLYVFVLNGPIVVQTFFLISSYLLMYLFCKIMVKHQFRWVFIWAAFIGRYLRLTITYIIVLIIQSTILYHLGNGPYWEKIIGTERKYCRENWWTNILYINNFYNYDKPCAQQSWYLAADSQLFYISLIIIALIWNYRKWAKYIFGIFTVIALLIPGIVAYVYQLPALMFLWPDILKNMIVESESYYFSYISAYSSGATYMVGLIAGYFYIHHQGDYGLLQPYRFQAAWWIISLTLPISMLVVGIYMYYVESYSIVVSVFFNMFYKFIFACGLAYAATGISLKLGWFARWLLKWKPLIVLGRVSFCTYLVHIGILKYYEGIYRQPMHYSINIIVRLTISNIVLSFLLGLALCLLIEFPTSGLQKLLTSGFIETPQKQKTTESNGKTVGLLPT